MSLDDQEVLTQKEEDGEPKNYEPKTNKTEDDQQDIFLFSCIPLSSSSIPSMMMPFFLENDLWWDKKSSFSRNK